MCLSGSRFCLCISKMPYSLREHCFLLQCSKSCEGGFRVREVRCLSDDMTTSTHCDPQLKPEEKEPCNTQDCIPEIGRGTLCFNHGTPSSGERGCRVFLSQVQSFVFTQTLALFLWLKEGFCFHF